MPGESAYLFKIEGPLLTPPPAGTMAARGFFGGVERVVRRRGGSFDRILARHGLEPAVARDPDYAIRCTTAASLLDDCSASLNDHLFGLRLGESLDTDVYGAISAYARLAPTIRRGIEILQEYVPILYSPGADVEFVAAGEIAEFRWRASPDFESDEQANYYGQVLILKFLQSLIGPEFRPSYVRMSSELWQRDKGDLEHYFGAAAFGGAPANTVAFPKFWLERQVQGANELLFGLMSSYFSKIKQATQRSFAEEVREYVRGAVTGPHCTIERCGTKLRISSRTIQRRLIEQGLKFSDLVEEQRIEAAKHALRETEDALAEIALNLGYSDQSSFGRAFKRWTGEPPLAYRAGGRRGVTAPGR